MNNCLFGIDFGSKLTGNTVIAILRDNKISMMQVGKNVDADQFIMNAAEHFKPKYIFLDSPLSLPGIYFGLKDCTSYHFRKADQELRAMSPMFLGGMLARAMELKQKLHLLEIPVFETYPKILSQKLELKKLGYKTNKSALKACSLELSKILSKHIELDYSEIKTWHHLDATLALISALNYREGYSVAYGLPEEGLIIV